MKSKRKGQKKQTAPKSRRSKERFPAVKPELNLLIRREEIEDVAEYFGSLPESAKIWMNKFMEEYVNAKLDRENISNNIHNTKELKKTCDARNNKRNRDAYSLSKAKGLVDYIEDNRGLEAEIQDEYESEQDVFEFNNSSNKTENDDGENI
jgi:hypothetical protein